MDISSNLDLHRIVFVQVGLSTLASVSVSPSYNLPVHLYGLYNIDNEVDNPSPAVLEGLRQYCILLVLTAILDLFWMYNWSSSTSGIPFMLILIGLIIKPISLMTCLNQLSRNGGQGFGAFSSHFTGTRGPPAFHGLNQGQTVGGGGGGGLQRDTPAWAPSHSNTAAFRRADNAPPPGPSSVSHQALSAAHEFALDDHADAQNLSDDEVRRAKKELDLRIALKKQQIQQQQQSQQQQQQQQQQTVPPNPQLSTPSPAQPVDGSGYHTLE